MKCNETQGKWCKNKHGASKIIDTFETYQTSLSGVKGSWKSFLFVLFNWHRGEEEEPKANPTRTLFLSFASTTNAVANPQWMDAVLLAP
jgi:hypothetical protein